MISAKNIVKDIELNADMLYKDTADMSNLNLKQTEQKNQKQETADSKQDKQLPLTAHVSASDISKSWVSFEPKVPLTYLVAARKAAREKNS